MLTENLVPLTVGFVIAAVAMLAGAILARRRIRAAAEGVRRVEIVLAERAAMWPIILSTTRSDLAERSAATDQLLWSINQFDRQVGGATTELAKRRAGIQALRVQVEGSRVGIERIKSVAHLIMRAIELRRTILG